VDVALLEAGVAPEAIAHLFLTGGTSFMPAVRRLFETRFRLERGTTGGEFVSVAGGIGTDRSGAGVR
jgi:hypothetical chaperone protein